MQSDRPAADSGRAGTDRGLHPDRRDLTPLDSQARPSHPALRALLGVVAVIAAGIGLANMGFAVVDPCELEVREGTVWLHVLAQAAGVSLYDHGQVAFVNMMHGPLDPLLKAWIHAVMPSLPSAVVTRAFVALMPLALGTLFLSTVKTRAAALAWAAGTYLFLLSLGDVAFLIGRSDPAAMSFLCLLLLTGYQATRKSNLDPLATAGRGAAIGAAIGIVALINWRYLPAALAAGFLFGIEIASRAPAEDRGISIAGSYVTGAVGAALLAGGLVLVTLFHGNLDLYYRHFFGIMTRESGWGPLGRMPFELFSSELLDGHWLIHLGLLLAIFAAARTETKSNASPAVTVSWLVMLGALWCVYALGFFYNHGAAGFHYFAPFYVFAAFYCATRLTMAGSRRLVITAAAFLIVGLPWSPMWRQAARLRDTAQAARRFSVELRQRVGDAYVYSEDLHLFRSRYAGEPVDVGDTAAQIAATGYFGDEHRATLERHYATLRDRPPRFVLVGAITVTSPQLQQLLKNRYEKVATSEPLILAQGGLPVSLYRRKSAEPHD